MAVIFGAWSEIEGEVTKLHHSPKQITLPDHTLTIMQLYTIPASVDQQIEDLLSEQIQAEIYKRKQYQDLLNSSEIKILRLQVALNSLTKY